MGVAVVGGYSESCLVMAGILWDDEFVLKKPPEMPGSQSVASCLSSVAPSHLGKNRIQCGCDGGRKDGPGWAPFQLSF